MPKFTESTFHQPAVVAQPECVEKCKRLQGHVNAAILEAVARPDDQEVVVCNHYGKLLCHGNVLCEGFIIHTNDEDGGKSDDEFIRNPVDHQAGSRNFTTQSEIRDAAYNGAERYETRGTKIVTHEIAVAPEQ